MSPVSASKSPLHEEGDPEVARYQAVCLLAVAGLALGLGGAVALVEPALWPLPAAGAATAALALWRIARSDGVLVGRRMAVTGLWLSLAFCAAAAAERWTYQWRLHREAQEVAAYWLDFLRHDCPVAAFALMEPLEQRRVGVGVTAMQWEDEVRGDPQRAGALKTFKAQPVVRKLLALGEKAHARCRQIEDLEDEDVMRLVYAVTADDAEGEQPFRVVVVLRRVRYQAAEGASWRLGQADWQVLDAE